jgi:hypothetical protein
MFEPRVPSAETAGEQSQQVVTQGSHSMSPLRHGHELSSQSSSTAVTYYHHASQYNQHQVSPPHRDHFDAQQHYPREFAVFVAKYVQEKSLLHILPLTQVSSLPCELTNHALEKEVLHEFKRYGVAWVNVSRRKGLPFAFVQYTVSLLIDLMFVRMVDLNSKVLGGCKEGYGVRSRNTNRRSSMPDGVGLRRQ